MRTIFRRRREVVCSYSERVNYPRGYSWQ